MSSGQTCYPALSLDHSARFFNSWNKMASPGAIFTVFFLTVISNLSLVNGQTANGFCSGYTTGGTGGGAACVIPFTYYNIQYNNCSTANNSGIPWCYTEQNPQIGSQWGNCVYNCSVSTTPTTVTTVTGPTGSGGNGTNCPVFTQSGNGNGKACKFPFTYRGTQMNACTKMNHDRLWCATTSDYDADREWGDCIIYTDRSDQCVFPFTLVSGSNSIIYNECTGDRTAPGTTICGIESTVYVGSPQVGFCQPQGFCPSKFPPTATTQTTTIKSVTNSSNTGGATELQCSMTTQGGNAGPGSKCVFPFTYQGLKYYGCTSDGWNQPWCATSNNYTRDLLYGNCNLNTLAGTRCTFPFTYQGKEYMECTGESQTALWCATTSSFLGFNTGAWGFCDIRYEPKCGVPNTVAPGPACQTTYETVLNTLSLNGNLKSALKTLDQCRDGCTESSACAAFDFDIGFTECYFHGDNYVDSLKTTNVVNVNQYRKEPCLTTTVAAATGSGCIDTFTRMPNTLSLRGEQEPSISTRAACQTSCLNDPGCYAFDFDNNRGECFKHKDGFLLYVQLDSAGVDQYRRVFCSGGATTTPAGCNPTYERIQNTKSFSGALSRGVVDVDGCKTACTASPKCSAFDFDNTILACYLHDSGYMNDLDANAPGVDQYRKDDSSCADATDCTDTFRIFQDTLTIGGTILNSISTAEDCMAECLKLVDCAGFDFDLTTKECYYHKTGFELSAKTKDDGVRDVHQYRRSACDDATDSGTTRSAATSTARTTVRPDPASSCEYEKVESTMSFDGILVEEVSTASECETHCSSKKPPCAAFDFNTFKKTCYFHGNNYLSNTDTVDGIDQYRLKDCKCEVTYKLEVNTFAYEGLAQSGVTNVAGCQEKCTKDKSCTGFDFNRVQKACFLHTSQTIGQKIDGNPDADHYQKESCATDCTPSYDMFLNTLSTGGVENTDSKSTSSCQDVCTADKDCKAFDFDTRKKECFIHSVSFKDNVKSQDQGVTDVVQYRKKGCEGSSGGLLKKLGMMTVGGGNQIKKNALLVTVFTKAIEQTSRPTETSPYVKTTTSTTTSTTSATTTSTTQSTTTVTSTTVPTTTIPTTTIPTTTIPTTTIPTTFPTTTISSTTLRTEPPTTTPCIPTYRRTQAALARGGIVQPNALTLDSCQNACTEMDNCAGFDFYTNGTCVVHSVDSILSMRYDVAGVDNFRKLDCNTGLPYQKSISKFEHRLSLLGYQEGCSFKHVPNQMAFFGKSRYSANTLDKCKTACLEDNNCKAFDFNRVHSSCFLHSGYYIQFIQENKFIDQYVKECYL